MYHNNFEELREEARDTIMEELAEYEGYLCDFHNSAFNEDYYECYTDRAGEKLDKLGVYEAIGYIYMYEKEQFGDVNTDFSNPCSILNMLWYIVGEEELYDIFESCEMWDNWWNDDITNEQAKELVAWAKENEMEEE